MHQNIAAFTPNESEYPPFVSVNVWDDGAVSISVRSPKVFDEGKGYNVCGVQSEIRMTKDEFAKLIESALGNHKLWLSESTKPPVAPY